MKGYSWRREFRSAQDACCLCLNASKLTSMQDDVLFNSKTQNYSQIMDICLSIQIPSDCMVCADCGESLKQLWFFFSLIEITQNRLRGIIANVKDEPKEINHPDEISENFIKQEIMLNDANPDCGDVFISNDFVKYVEHAPCELEVKTESTETSPLKVESISSNLEPSIAPDCRGLDTANVKIKDEPNEMNRHENTPDSFIKEEIMLQDSAPDYDDIITSNCFSKSVPPEPSEIEIRTKCTQPLQLENESITIVNGNINHTTTISKKRKYAYNYNAEWEQNFFFTMLKDKLTCIICLSTLPFPTENNCVIHFTAFHEEYKKNYPLGTDLRKAKVQELMTKLKLNTMSETTTMASFQKTTESIEPPAPKQSKEEVIPESLMPLQSQNVSALGVNGNLVYLTTMGAEGWCIINGPNHSNQIVDETFPQQNTLINHLNILQSASTGIGAPEQWFLRLAPSATNTTQGPTQMCSNCQIFGHISDQCPNKIQPPLPVCSNCQIFGHISDQCPNKIPPVLSVCSNCQLFGHISDQCPNKIPPPLSVCSNCQIIGHISDQCPIKISPPLPVCSNCQIIGHTSNQCLYKISTLEDVRTEKMNGCNMLTTSGSLKNSVSYTSKDRRYTYRPEWEYDYFFIMFEDKCTCIICHKTISNPAKYNCERHFITNHGQYENNYPLGTELRKNKLQELVKQFKLSAASRAEAESTKKASLEPAPWMRCDFAMEENAAMASLEITEHFSKHKKPIKDVELWKDTFIKAGKVLFKTFNNRSEIIASIEKMVLSKNTVMPKSNE